METTADLLVHDADLLATVDDDRREIAGGWVAVTGGVVSGVGAMAAAMGGIDALAFTAGVGEGSPRVRQQVCERLSFLGVELDPVANAEPAPEMCLSVDGARTRTYVVEAREDLEVARGVGEVMSRR